MANRTIEDRLREEYFELLPDIRRVLEELEARVRFKIMPISLGLDQYERIVIRSRVKECDSALDSLRRRQEGATFDREHPDEYTLTNLRDLAGVRLLVFPRSHLEQIDLALRREFSHWEADHIRDSEPNDAPLALKYHGYCGASDRIRGEYQIVPMLTGLFWEVEHSAIYKPAPQLRGVAREPAMQERTRAVLTALGAFEREFEDLIRRSSAVSDDGKIE